MPSLHALSTSWFNHGLLSKRFVIPVSLLFLLLIAYLFFLVSPTFAAAQPNPQPCFNPEPTSNLTDNYVTNSDGTAPIQLTVTASGHRGDSVTPSEEFTYQVDFSKLQAIFGTPNSDYTEGRFQDPTHQKTDLLSLSGAPLLNFQGPSDKAGSKVATDTLRQKYVKYVYEKNTLGESGNKFTDYNGQNPKTIYDLVTAYGLPNPPQANEDKTIWNQQWGKYWQKLPAAYDEFYIGKLEFRDVAGQDLINKLLNGQFCTLHSTRTVEFPVPNFFRTAATTGGDNITMVPRVAQAPDNDPIGIASAAITNIKDTASNLIQFCFKFAKNTPLAKAVKKISKVSLEIFTTKNAYAAIQDSQCLKIIPEGKAGNAPFCALYPNKADGSLNINPGECQDVRSSLKLNPETNVNCTFRTTWTGDAISIGSTGPGAFDSCGPPDENDIITCTIKVYIYPDFRVPFLCQSWNNSTYSNEKANCASNPQETGRSGSYAFFTPQASQEKDPLQQLIDNCSSSTPADATHPIPPGCTALVQWGHDNHTTYPALETCIMSQLLNIPNLIKCFDGIARSVVKELPGQTNNVLGANTESSASGQVLAAQDNEKQRLIGGVDCTKHLSRDINLKPRVLQENLGINYQCSLTASSGNQPPQPPPPPPPDGPPPGLGGDCGGKYNSTNAPAGNFGDSRCDFSVTNLDALLTSLDPPNADTWHAIIQLESTFNPNAVAAAVNGTAYGLVQMDSGLNGQYDNGQVPWRTQVSNAINYNNNLKTVASPSGSGTLEWCYWQAAYPPYLNLVSYAQCGL